MLPRSAFAPRKKNSHRADKVKRCPKFLQWLRGRDCCIGGTWAGRIEAAHVDYAGDKGMGTKSSDRYATPMCSAHHAESHMAGIKTFEKRHAVNLLALSMEYWKAWPGRHRWEQDNG